jgi:hypothetical protein
MTTMYDTPPTQKPVAQADNLTIAAFILVFFVPLVGLIMGVVSRRQAKRAGMKPNALATWTVWLGGIFTVISATIIIAVIATMGAAVNQASSGTWNPDYTAPAVTAPAYTNTSTPIASAAPVGTVSQQNALSSAQDYLSMQAFSKAGLIDQLSSKSGEGFRKADAVWAVNHLNVSWFKEAVKSARDYLSMQSFSRSGLIDQLSSPYGEQFTVAQATYAANKVGL